MPGIKKTGIFYGWWIVFAATVVMFLGIGIAFYCFGVFYVPLEQEFGWSRAEVAMGMSIFTISQGIIGVLAGRLTDSYGPKFVMTTGAISVGTSFLLRTFMTDLWQLYALSAIMGAGISTLSSVTISTIVSNWFTKKRGLALAITLTGSGFGGMLMVPISQILISDLGWRFASAILGLLGLVITLPLILLVIKTRPQDIGLLPDGEDLRGTEMQEQVIAKLEPSTYPAKSKEPSSIVASLSLNEAWKTPVYWLMASIFVLLGMNTTAILNHTVPMLLSFGVDSQTAANALGLTAGIGVFGKMVSGILSDRLGARLVFVVIVAFQGIGIGVLLATGNIAMVWAFVVVFGIGNGGYITLRALIVGQMFGVGSFGAIYGLLVLFATMGGAIGPLLAGWIYDTTKSYQPAIIIFSVGYFLATAGLFFARAPRREESSVAEKVFP